MRNLPIHVVAPALIALAAAGCATSRDAAPTTDERVCVRVEEIDSFQALDELHVVVDAGVNESYLLTVQRPCGGLSFARVIAIAEPVSRICNDGFSWLAFDQAGGVSRRCRIVDIEPVADMATARDVIGSRRE